MKIDTEKQDKLSERLASLSAEAAIALMREVERDKLRGEDTYPHDFVCSQLRKTIEETGLKVDRLGSPRRLFCEPFEVFLVDEKSDSDQRGAISRKSIAPIWNWLLGELFCDQLPVLEVEIIKALLDNEPDCARQLMKEFHKEAGDRIWAELSKVEEGSRAHLGYNVKFGGIGIFEDALEIARVLQIAPAFNRLSKQVQSGTTLQHDEDIHHCVGLYRQFVNSASAHAELGMLLIAARLKNRYEILKVVRNHIGTDNYSVAMKDPAFVSGTTVLFNLEQSVAEAIKIIPQYDDFGFVAHRIAEFHSCAELFTSFFNITPNSLWGSRLIQIRNDLSSAIQVQIEQLPRLINSIRYHGDSGSNFQTHKSAGPNSEPGPNNYDVNQAIFTAKLLMLSGKFLSQLSIYDAVTKAKHDANNFIETVAERIVSDLAKAVGQEKQVVQKYFKPMVDLTLIIQGKEIAALLERRGEAAARSAPIRKTAAT